MVACRLCAVLVNPFHFERVHAASEERFLVERYEQYFGDGVWVYGRYFLSLIVRTTEVNFSTVKWFTLTVFSVWESNCVLCFIFETRFLKGTGFLDQFSEIGCRKG